ncbi:BQ5605_C008g04912 [Microbotryum silenes-dioicae]|uniref:BQ5605_C008g04912 protein n=1 Tax=Microbotryum silenes-dioicae TaxID=796604 RepID=A0A2X0MEY0_9BASI|nr:BQ5605_C008g04912 [Microbotryum silenes-dioicae]
MVEFHARSDSSRSTASTSSDTAAALPSHSVLFPPSHLVPSSVLGDYQPTCTA